MIKAFICLVSILGASLVEAQYANLTQNPGSLCDRPCVSGQPRVCYYKWILEHYQVMGVACGDCEKGVEKDCYKPQCIIGDGIQKGAMSINRLIPGPAIHACEGDKIVIDVQNMAQGTAASIHWHGIHMMDTPFMDGVPFATQCPILFDTTFRYWFTATEPGTHFYHSHAGHAKLNGQYGALIIRQAEEDNLSIDEYDYDLLEHYILVSDWKHSYAEQSFPGLPRGESFADSLLINGRGTFVNKDTFNHTIVPVTKYYVKNGYNYRFRIIGATTLTTNVQLQIEGHSMVVIGTDSFDTEPIEFDTLCINAGERYDVVINAKKGKGDYFVRVRHVPNGSTQPTDTFALLRYINDDSDYRKPQPPFPAYTNTYPIGYRLNHPSATCFDNDKEYCAADLTALVREKDLFARDPDYNINFSFENYIIPVDKGFIPGQYVRFDNPEGDVIAAGIVNNMSLAFQSVPMLTQYAELDQNEICNEKRWPARCKGKPYCVCTTTYKFKTNSIVQMNFMDNAYAPGLDHPFHLHGYRFALTGMEKMSSNVTKAIESASRYRKSRPVLKDTVSVPANGVASARFRANNPGIWLMHCHYELHLATGMATIFQVGEPSEWVQAPKDFPKCGNYLPEVKKIGY